MADQPLTVFEKYPDSRRIDHKDFPDVSKTTYAVGVISDFKVDDPDDLIGTIHSQIKVTGGFGESDWIPLFYHPKAQYWDDENAKATDFDQEKVNFERAWMSFRGMDEVAVMLKEGPPVAVIGFADGIPRVGENIIKAVGQTAGWFDILKGQDYAQQDVGPDGRQLRLTHLGKVISQNSSDKQHGPFWMWDNAPVGFYYDEFPGPPEGWAYNFAFSRTSYVEYLRMIDTSITVGPLIFIIQTLLRLTVNSYWSAQISFASPSYGGNGALPPYYAKDFVIDEHNPGLKPEINPLSWGGIIWDGPYSGSDAGMNPWELYINVQAALYNETTMNPRISEPGSSDIGTGIWHNQYEGFKDYPMNTGFIYNASGLPNGFMGEPALQFFTRPHSPAEGLV